MFESEAHAVNFGHPGHWPGRCARCRAPWAFPCLDVARPESAEAPFPLRKERRVRRKHALVRLLLPSGWFSTREELMESRRSLQVVGCFGAAVGDVGRASKAFFFCRALRLVSVSLSSSNLYTFFQNHGELGVWDRCPHRLMVLVAPVLKPIPAYSLQHGAPLYSLFSVRRSS